MGLSRKIRWPRTIFLLACYLVRELKEMTQRVTNEKPSKPEDQRAEGLRSQSLEARTAAYGWVRGQYRACDRDVGDRGSGHIGHGRPLGRFGPTCLLSETDSSLRSLKRSAQ